MVEKTDSTRQEKTSRKLQNTNIKIIRITKIKIKIEGERECHSSEQEFFALLDVFL